MRELEAASAEQAALMRVAEGTEIAKIRRVRCVNDDPTSIETTYIPRQFLSRPDLLEGTLYAHWREEAIEPVALQYQTTSRCRARLRAPCWDCRLAFRCWL